MKPKILFIDTVHPLIKERLEQHGYQCDWLPGKGYPYYESIIGDYTGIVIRSGITLDRNILEKGTALKFIARLGSGLENIDVAFAGSRGIRCLNSPEGNRDAVGEHAVGMLLALMNRLLIADREVRNGIWKREENRGTEIRGKTVAIIGYGNMGSAFAQRLSGFGCRTIAFDKYKTGFENAWVEEVTMEEVFAEADVVSLHIPLTGETRYLVEESWIRSFRKPFILINTSRGPVVNTADLTASLEQDLVTGAALDVIEYEESSFEVLQSENLPAPFQYLKRSDRVLLSPHIAGWTHESKIRLAEVLVEKILLL
ncbi:MAG TPA: NAD(P)-dependent oxidoreductase [Bacteroidales bacterium]|nr:NAD(P)-dependent oxidoreductase [Bacteroidales bacterium]HRZ48160.1 NAD(P)-dependent oxidoreductase [Bacteroidales bacterium]